MFEIRFTSRFKKEYKQMIRRGCKPEKLAAVLEMLSHGERLPFSMHDHELQGTYKGHRECHIEPDWLLIYRIDGNELILTAVRTGSHSDLF